MLKLHLFAGGSIDLEENHFKDQICLYARGVAAVTESECLQTIRFIAGNRGRQMRRMRELLEEVYQQGDKLFIIGFSRGASAAREFAVSLDKNGLKPKDGKRIKDVEIEFLGCFDTVSMETWTDLPILLYNAILNKLTKSTRLKENGKVAPKVKQAVHLVSLDDNRQFGISPSPFPPILMGKEERVHEVWFPGQHGDVGGGFYLNGLSDVACEYMMKWMKKAGVKFIEDPNDIKESSLEIKERPDINLKEEKYFDKIKITPNPGQIDNIEPDCKSSRPVLVFENDKPSSGAVVNIHESVLDHFIARKVEGKNDYKLNTKLKNVEFRVVGKSGEEFSEELIEKTKDLKTILEEIEDEEDEKKRCCC